LFPGRTLEELDEMDYARLQRAMEARNIERVEELRGLTLAKKRKATPDEYRQFVAHDTLFRKFYGCEDAVPDPGAQ
jgi:hypothetical protein